MAEQVTVSAASLVSQLKYIAKDVEQINQGLAAMIAMTEHRGPLNRNLAAIVKAFDEINQTLGSVKNIEDLEKLNNQLTNLHWRLNDLRATAATVSPSTQVTMTAQQARVAAKNIFQGRVDEEVLREADKRMAKRERVNFSREVARITKGHRDEREAANLRREGYAVHGVSSPARERQQLYYQPLVDSVQNLMGMLKTPRGRARALTQLRPEQVFQPGERLPRISNTTQLIARNQELLRKQNKVQNKYTELLDQANYDLRAAIKTFRSDPLTKLTPELVQVARQTFRALHGLRDEVTGTITPGTTLRLHQLTQLYDDLNRAFRGAMPQKLSAPEPPVHLLGDHLIRNIIRQLPNLATEARPTPRQSWGHIGYGRPGHPVFEEYMQQTGGIFNQPVRLQGVNLKDPTLQEFIRQHRGGQIRIPRQLNAAGIAHFYGYQPMEMPGIAELVGGASGMVPKLITEETRIPKEIKHRKSTGKIHRQPLDYSSELVKRIQDAIKLNIQQFGLRADPILLNWGIEDLFRSRPKIGQIHAETGQQYLGQRTWTPDPQTLQPPPPPGAHARDYWGPPVLPIVGSVPGQAQLRDMQEVGPGVLWAGVARGGQANITNTRAGEPGWLGPAHPDVTRYNQEIGNRLKDPQFLETLAKIPRNYHTIAGTAEDQPYIEALLKRIHTGKQTQTPLFHPVQPQTVLSTDMRGMLNFQLAWAAIQKNLKRPGSVLPDTMPLAERRRIVDTARASETGYLGHSPTKKKLSFVDQARALGDTATLRDLEQLTTTKGTRVKRPAIKEYLAELKDDAFKNPTTPLGVLRGKKRRGVFLPGVLEQAPPDHVSIWDKFTQGVENFFASMPKRRGMVDLWGGERFSAARRGKQKWEGDLLEKATDSRDLFLRQLDHFRKIAPQHLAKINEIALTETPALTRLQKIADVIYGKPGKLSPVFVDTETTGFGKPIHEFASKLSGNEVFQRLINPDHRYHPEAANLISKDPVVQRKAIALRAKQPIFAKQAAAITATLGDPRSSTIIAHNASFDVNQLNTELTQAGLMPIQHRVLDTETLARKLMPGLPSYKLGAVAEHLKIQDIDPTKFHGAAYDTQVLEKVYNKLMADPRIHGDIREALKLAEVGYVQKPVEHKLPPRIASVQPPPSPQESMNIDKAYQLQLKRLGTWHGRFARVQPHTTEANIAKGLLYKLEATKQPLDLKDYQAAITKLRTAYTTQKYGRTGHGSADPGEAPIITQIEKPNLTHIAHQKVSGILRKAFSADYKAIWSQLQTGSGVITPQGDRFIKESGKYYQVGGPPQKLLTPPPAAPPPAAPPPAAPPPAAPPPAAPPPAAPPPAPRTLTPIEAYRLLAAAGISDPLKVLESIQAGTTVKGPHGGQLGYSGGKYTQYPPGTGLSKLPPQQFELQKLTGLPLTTAGTHSAQPNWQQIQQGPIRPYRPWGQPAGSQWGQFAGGQWGHVPRQPPPPRTPIYGGPAPPGPPPGFSPMSAWQPQPQPQQPKQPGVAHGILGYMGMHLIIGGYYRLISAMRQSIDQAAEFQIMLGRIQTISNQATTMGIRPLAAEITTLSKKWAESPTGMAQAAYIAISNQLHATRGYDPDFPARGQSWPALTGFLDDAALFGRAAATPVEESVEALASVLNSYRLGPGAAGQVGAEMFKTIELGRVVGPQLRNILGRVMPLSAELGVDRTEIMAGIAHQTIMGMKPEESLTLLGNTMLRLIKPTKEMQDELDRLGIMSTGLAVRGRGLQGFLEHITQYSGTAAENLGDMFGRIRAVRGVSTLIGSQSEQYKKIHERIKDVTPEDLKVAADKITKLPAMDYKALQARFQAHWADVMGPALMGAYNWAVGGMGPENMNFYGSMAAGTGLGLAGLAGGTKILEAMGWLSLLSQKKVMGASLGLGLMKTGLPAVGAVYAGAYGYHQYRKPVTSVEEFKRDQLRLEPEKAGRRLELQTEAQLTIRAQKEEYAELAKSATESFEQIGQAYSKNQTDAARWGASVDAVFSRTIQSRTAMVQGLISALQTMQQRADENLINLRNKQLDTYNSASDAIWSRSIKDAPDWVKADAHMRRAQQYMDAARRSPDEDRQLQHAESAQQLAIRGYELGGTRGDLMNISRQHHELLEQHRRREQQTKQQAARAEEINKAALQNIEEGFNTIQNTPLVGEKESDTYHAADKIRTDAAKQINDALATLTGDDIGSLRDKIALKSLLTKATAPIVDPTTGEFTNFQTAMENYGVTLFQKMTEVNNKVGDVLTDLTALFENFELDPLSNLPRAAQDTEKLLAEMLRRIESQADHAIKMAQLEETEKEFKDTVPEIIKLGKQVAPTFKPGTFFDFNIPSLLFVTPKEREDLGLTGPREIYRGPGWRERERRGETGVYLQSEDAPWLTHQDAWDKFIERQRTLQAKWDEKTPWQQFWSGETPPVDPAIFDIKGQNLQQRLAQLIPIATEIREANFAGNVEAYKAGIQRFRDLQITEQDFDPAWYSSTAQAGPELKKFLEYTKNLADTLGGLDVDAELGEIDRTELPKAILKLREALDTFDSGIKEIMSPSELKTRDETRNEAIQYYLDTVNKVSSSTDRVSTEFDNVAESARRLAEYVNTRLGPQALPTTTTTNPIREYFIQPASSTNYVAGQALDAQKNLIDFTKNYSRGELDQAHDNVYHTWNLDREFDSSLPPASAQTQQKVISEIFPDGLPPVIHDPKAQTSYYDATLGHIVIGQAAVDRQKVTKTIVHEGIHSQQRELGWGFPDDFITEVGPTIGGHLAEYEARRRDSGLRDHTLTVLASGVEYSLEQLNNMAKQHGFYAGKPIDELLSSTAGQQFLNRIISAQKNTPVLRNQPGDMRSYTSGDSPASISAGIRDYSTPDLDQVYLSGGGGGGDYSTPDLDQVYLSGGGGGEGYSTELFMGTDYTQIYEFAGGMPQAPDIDLQSFNTVAANMSQTTDLVAQALHYLGEKAAQAAAMLASIQPPTQNFAKGGDVVNASLTPGEFVMNPRSTSRWYPTIKAMNRVDQPRFATGGDVTNVGDVIVNINNASSQQLNGRNIAQAVRRELRNKTARLT